ncbi:hypothetical protein F4Z99_04065 [Candidatus Poribacteria bacterium]|nr:hypothetical protein [Candidatus Poribacteria bacterium]
MSNSNFNVGDAVKVYGSGHYSEYYIIGRIIHIDYKKGGNEYGVLYYARNKTPLQDLLTVQASEHQIRKMPVENPPCCPSHGFVMDYVDEIAENER